ncbi:MAG: FAD-dependent oxidoreductase [bacterium]|nr:FAD-dependent oxidoreductase [bacterium]MDE0290297.1 FAD-dependent oxidoreductase [bacterium]MDE0440335.1 FAD-dependent oxidoreductase [bacterium]
MIREDPLLRFLIIGGGPAGTAAASTAAAHGADVTLVEDSVVGGAAHLRDCIPSKAMAAMSIRMQAIRNAGDLGIADHGAGVDLGRLADRIRTVTSMISARSTELLESQGVEILKGRGRFVSPNQAVAVVDGADRVIEFDAALISTGSRPRVPEWARVDGDRILTTRHVYDLPAPPEHVVVIGSGVTGVEMVHIFESLGSKVTLLVSRHHVLPHRDAEVAAALETDFLERGVALLKGARAVDIERSGNGVIVHVGDGRRVYGSHALLAVGAVPMSDCLGLEEAEVETEGGFIVVDQYQRTSVPHIYAAGDVTGQMLLSSVANQQGRNLARHATGHPGKAIDYSKVAQAIFTEPEIASVGLEEADAAAEGRKVRITKVPFTANPRSVIHGSTRGFAKVVSDPATRVVLGGTVVGHRASELIGILALATRGKIKVQTLRETLMVHPTLSESISDAGD